MKTFILILFCTVQLFAQTHNFSGDTSITSISGVDTSDINLISGVQWLGYATGGGNPLASDSLVLYWNDTSGVSLGEIEGGTNLWYPIVGDESSTVFFRCYDVNNYALVTDSGVVLDNDGGGNEDWLYTNIGASSIVIGDSGTIVFVAQIPDTTAAGVLASFRDGAPQVHCLGTSASGYLTGASYVGGENFTGGFYGDYVGKMACYVYTFNGTQGYIYVNGNLITEQEDYFGVYTTDDRMRVADESLVIDNLTIRLVAFYNNWVATASDVTDILNSDDVQAKGIE